MKMQMENYMSRSFDRVNVENHPSVKLVDSDPESGLDLFCYTDCENDSDEFVQQCRGLVYHENKLVMKAFSHIPEYCHSDVGSVRSVLADFEKWTFYPSYEGTLLRVFNFNGKWFVTTHRKLNAFRSKWSSRDSFGAMFENALFSEATRYEKFAHVVGDVTREDVREKFTQTLNPEYQYMFLVRSTNDNRIVSDAPDYPTVYHVGTFVDGKLNMDVDVSVTKPDPLVFDSANDVLTFVREKVNPKVTQGVIGFGPNNKQLKIVQDSYRELFLVRGNEPSIKFRYLQLRQDKKMVDLLFYLYPNMKPVFADYENTLRDIAKYIYNAYIDRFMKKNFVTVSRDKFEVVKECHSFYLLDRQRNHITFNHVLFILNKQSPTNLNRLIYNYNVETGKILKRPVLHRCSNAQASDEIPLLELPLPQLSLEQSEHVVRIGELETELALLREEAKETTEDLATEQSLRERTERAQSRT